MEKKTLPTLKVDVQDIANMKKAIAIFNQNSIVEMSIAGFRRYAYKMMAQLILRGDELPMDFK